MKTSAPLLALAALSLLAACGAEHTQGSQEDPFGATTWQLRAATVDGTSIPLVDGSPVTLFVDNAQVGGTAACNGYGGPIVVADGVVTIGPSLSQTEMACLADGVMDLEAAYLAALPRVTSAARDGEALVLGGDGVALRFSPQPEPATAPLIGTNWALETIVEGDTASTPAAPATLVLAADGSITGSTGCNQLFGTYDPDTGFGTLGSTKMACKDAVMAQETVVLQILGGAPTLTIDGPILTIADLDGRALVYREG